VSVVDRTALEASPLADLHAIAAELSIDGYRRLRRPELIDAILGKQGTEDQPQLTEASADEEAREAAVEPEPELAPAGDQTEGVADELAQTSGDELVEAVADELRLHDGGGTRVRRRRGRRGGRGRGTAADEPAAAEREPAGREREPGGREREAAGGEREAAGAEREAAGAEREAAGPEAEAGVPERGTDAKAPERAREREGEEELVEGVVEMVPGGAAFLRVHAPDSSDDDVYISAAQVKRCELVSGDRVSGPERPPRRSERFASLTRVDMINGRPAAEVADSTRFDDLPATFPDQLIELGSDDPTLAAISWQTPFGRGSRVTIVGPPRAGKSELLRRLASALTGHEGLDLLLVLAGVRPEEISEWQRGATPPADAVSFAASPDAQAQAVEQVIDQARRLTSRGADSIVLVDTLGGMPPHLARRALAAARNIEGGGSLTVIATAPEQVGGETTVIALDALLTGSGRFPAIDLLRSGTIRAELLVGDEGAEAIARARAEAIG